MMVMLIMIVMKMMFDEAFNNALFDHGESLLVFCLFDSWERDDPVAFKMSCRNIFPDVFLLLSLSKNTSTF